MRVCRTGEGHRRNTKDVVITLQGIDLTGKTITKDNVSFGCTGVTVNSATVNSATEITANITIAATAQEHVRRDDYRHKRCRHRL